MYISCTLSVFYFFYITDYFRSISSTSTQNSSSYADLNLIYGLITPACKNSKRLYDWAFSSSFFLPFFSFLQLLKFLKGSLVGRVALLGPNPTFNWLIETCFCLKKSPHAGILTWRHVGHNYCVSGCIDAVSLLIGTCQVRKNTNWLLILLGNLGTAHECDLGWQAKSTWQVFLAFRC